jgi:PilZ domain
MPRQTKKTDHIEPLTNTAGESKSWPGHWWSPDPRKAPRILSPGLTAYYWTGAAPQPPYVIRDISSTGLYLVTEERWYPGTVIRMTLTKTAGQEQDAERSISVESKAVRWGEDGVGLQFVLKEAQDLRREQSSLIDGMDRKKLEGFLKQLKFGAGQSREEEHILQAQK